MPNILVPITVQQQRALQRKARLAGRGSITSEIRKAITHYLAGPRYIEAAFMKLLEEKAPKDLPAMLARLKKTNARIDRSLAQLRPINVGVCLWKGLIPQKWLSGLFNRSVLSCD